ncbi:MAG: hypothetical protein GKR92_08430 [Gammaproteobacteria bacterium]|nr:MAG: hypothetical protein GKR92_08430 [Gammaproteobacteria bacterium]
MLIFQKHIARFFIVLATCAAFVPQVHAQIIVSELKTFSLGRWALNSGNITANQNICVGLRPRGPYSVTVNGDTHAGSFALKDGLNSIAYRLFFNDRPRTNGREELRPGQALTGQRGRRLRADGTCRRLSANLSLIVRESNIRAAAAGRYSATIVILVSPE